MTACTIAVNKINHCAMEIIEKEHGVGNTAAPKRYRSKWLQVPN